jgi:hypothetical protein
MGGPVPDRLLLFLAWQPCAADGAVTLAVAAFAELAWAFREVPGPVLPALVHAKVDVTAAEMSLPSIFQN